MTVITADIAVIGAGPAGSSAATFLARQGYIVVLIDHAAFSRRKPCGEYLTPGAVELLRDALGLLPELKRCGARSLTQEIVVGHGGQSFSGVTNGLTCNRFVTDQVLREAAEAAGTTVLENFTARRILFTDDAVTGVAGQNAYGEEYEIRARITLGADGTKSLLARTLGVVHPIRRLQQIALVAHYPVQDSEREESTVTMHLPRDKSDACCGVGAPCGTEKIMRNINIVVPVREARQIAGRRNDFFRERLHRSFPAVWERYGHLEMADELQSVGCFGHHTSRAAHSGALLVGDAATFIHPFTGEGVYFALRGAQFASLAVNQAFQKDDFSAIQLRSYDRARQTELLPRYRLCDLVQQIVHSPPLLAWATERLRRSSVLTELILGAVGDLIHPADLLSFSTLRLALSAF